MALYNDAHPRYITTIDGGWLVAIPTPGGAQRRVLTKTYRPQDQAALMHGIRWRDRAYRRLYGVPVPARTFHARTKDTVTGIPGVRYQIKKIKKKSTGKVYEIPVIIAEVFTVPGKDYQRSSGSLSRVYSLNKYDFDEAIAAAVAWRANLIDTLQK